MHAAGERVVQDEDVAWVHVVAVLREDGHHRIGNRAKVERDRQALRDHLAVGVTQRGRKIHDVLDHPGVSRPHDDQRHLVDDRAEGVLDQLEGDRVEGVSRHECLLPVESVTTMFSHASSVAWQPGGTTVVASYSSTMIGPSRSEERRVGKEGRDTWVTERLT